jgi:hypothetical protein
VLYAFFKVFLTIQYSANGSVFSKQIRLNKFINVFEFQVRPILQERPDLLTSDSFKGEERVMISLSFL